MFDTWQSVYNMKKEHTILDGWCFSSESDCSHYLKTRVKAKIEQANSTSLLQEYLVEMADTGFNTDVLRMQVDNPPLPKDWEVGEAFAEVMLEDKFDVSFPWPTAWDKRTPNASLPGPDIPGFYNKEFPQFLFGEVKSSSEERFPPQVVNSGDDCLCSQIKRLLAFEPRRQQLIGWLLVRTKDSPRWKPIFDHAMGLYAQGEACVCGVLVRGGISPTTDDLSAVQDEVTSCTGTFKVILLAFYLPFEKSKWVEIIYGTESVN